MSSVLAPHSFCIAGMATLTMLTSSTDMNMPVTSTASATSHGVLEVGCETGAGVAAGGVGETGAAAAVQTALTLWEFGDGGTKTGALNPSWLFEPGDAAGLEAARDGWRTVRVELADDLPADAMEAAIAAYEREGARLRSAARGVEAVAGALRGERWVPRL